MLIIGCDFHTRYQQIAMAREETGEQLVERRLDHENGEAAEFYRGLQQAQEPVRVGIEATGPIHWFERLRAELGHELWIGDSAKIRASEVRKQKTGERDAALILAPLLSKDFPRIWVPTSAERDLRQRHRGWRNFPPHICFAVAFEFRDGPSFADFHAKSRGFLHFDFCIPFFRPVA
jgi:transposase